MFDWKILAASFAALLVVSSVLVGDFGFSDILDSLRDWMGGSPFGGFVTAPVKEKKPAAIIIYPDNFEFPANGVSFKAGEVDFRDFSGTVTLNLSHDSMQFSPSNSELKVSMPLTNLTIEGVSIGRLSYESINFHVISHGLDTSGSDASLEVLDFSGRVKINPPIVRLDGNLTSVKGNGKDLV